MATQDRNVERLGALLENIDIAMFTTIGTGGDLVSRPLSTQQAEFDGERVWFFTEADSPKVAEIRRNGKVNVGYASKDRNTYISLSGDARLNRDPDKIEALWNDALKAFFPKGRNDPNLALIEVRVRSAEYWDGPGSAIGKLISFVVARVTKKEEVMSENRLVDFTGERVRSVRPPSYKGGGRKASKADASRMGGRGASASKSVAKKSAGKKSSAKKSSTKKAATKRTPATKKASAKKATSRR